MALDQALDERLQHGGLLETQERSVDQRTAQGKLGPRRVVPSPLQLDLAQDFAQHQAQVDGKGPEQQLAIVAVP